MGRLTITNKIKGANPSEFFVPNIPIRKSLNRHIVWEVLKSPKVKSPTKSPAVLAPYVESLCSLNTKVCLNRDTEM